MAQNLTRNANGYYTGVFSVTALRVFSTTTQMVVSM